MESIGLKEIIVICSFGYCVYVLIRGKEKRVCQPGRLRQGSSKVRASQKRRHQWANLISPSAGERLF